ncbi:MAG: S-methyl-5-thioribose-1-phosphate isomerase [Gemmatimonadaceae bacterium]
MTDISEPELAAVVTAVDWTTDGAGVRIVDQTRLPADFVMTDLHTMDAVCEAILTLRVRGAPAIGIAGAMGLVAAVAPHAGEPPDRFRWRLASAAERIGATRPTAVNLRWALERMVRRAERVPDADDAAAVLAVMRAEATAIRDEDRAMCRRIGEHGLRFVPDGARVLTHCNAGALATGGIGTALAPLYLAHAAGRRIEVLVDETRPLLQGSRLTAWELQRAGIAVTVLGDGMAASLMAAGGVDLCLVGADRIAANGDVANKVGTFGVALAARHHGLPFYVLAPSSTLDPATPTGAGIPIEQRAASEVTHLAGVATAPPGVQVYNPAFDVTPAALVTAIITDQGVFDAPYDFSRA